MKTLKQIYQNFDAFMNKYDDIIFASLIACISSLVVFLMVLQ